MRHSLSLPRRTLHQAAGKAAVVGLVHSLALQLAFLLHPDAGYIARQTLHVDGNVTF